MDERGIPTVHDGVEGVDRVTPVSPPSRALSSGMICWPIGGRDGTREGQTKVKGGKVGPIVPCRFSGLRKERKHSEPSH